MAYGIGRAELAVKVLSTLGVYDRSGMDPADITNVLDAYDAVYQELAAENLATWGQDGEDEIIPFAAMNSIVAIVAATDVLLGSYPQSGGDMQRIKMAADAGNRMIRKQVRGLQTEETTTTEYF